MQTAAVGKGFKCMGIGISKTIRNIYLDIIKNCLKPVQDSMIIHTYPPGTFTFFKWFSTHKALYDHVLYPEGKKIWSLDSNKLLADLQRILYTDLRELPICQICGANTEFGYKNCYIHLRPCCKCKRKEVDIGINGDEYCYDCYSIGILRKTRI